MPKIALWPTITAAYVLIFTRPLQLLRIGGIWLLWGCLDPFATFYVARLFKHPSILFVLVKASEVTVLLAGLISASVALHRLVLVGETRSWFAILRFRRREWRFLANGLLLFVGVVLLLFVLLQLWAPFVAVAKDWWLSVFFDPRQYVARYALWLILQVAELVLWSFGSWLVLAFPIIAADEDGDALPRAAELSKGHRTRLFLGSIICALPFFLLDWIAEKVLGPAHRAGIEAHLSNYFTYNIWIGDEWRSAVAFANIFLSGAVLIVFYSYCYRQIVGPALASEALMAKASP